MKTNQSTDFLDDAVETLATLAGAVGGGLACYGAINLLEGYEHGDPETKNYGLALVLKGASMAAFAPDVIRMGLVQLEAGSKIG